MPSRIDIGPEGGPFVAINENSNDLELQDINGNVIAVWDETAGQWDLNNNSLTNINAVDAASVDVEGGEFTDPGGVTYTGEIGTGTGLFEEDSNSPYTATDSDEIVVSDFDSYDLVVIVVEVLNKTDNTILTDMRVNGDESDNYTRRAVDGSEFTDETEFNRVGAAAAGETALFTIHVSQTRGGIGIHSHSGETIGSRLAYGQNTSVNHPLQQFTLFNDRTSDWTVEVLGRNV